MTTILFVFTTAFFLCLCITPMVIKFALHFQLVHVPSERCVHNKPMPRIGGIALFVSFFLSLIISLPFQTQVSILLHDSRILFLFFAAALIFFIGVIDDIRQLSASTKLLGQILAGAITWYGGIQINTISISLTSGIEISWLSLPLTVFWIVLVTNAINLIDGLDGLAAGICLCASLMMLILCVSTDKILIALLFAALSGTLLAFLRYNFNPASIFMGDCGSYFLGYTFAACSILGSLKGQTTAAMLIPFIALGVPLFDAIISPVRRFARNKKLFDPDQKHLHHRLLAIGISPQKAVLILYTVTLALGATAFALTLFKDEKAALILMIPLLAIIISFKKLGYLHYLAVDKFYGWVIDIFETSKISPGSRTFLDHQINLQNARSIEELWLTAKEIFEFLELDQVQLKIRQQEDMSSIYLQWKSQEKKSIQTTNHQFRIEFPLIQRNNITESTDNVYDISHIGDFTLVKDVTQKPIRQFTIRRIEQIKRSLVKKIPELTSMH